MAWCLQCGVKHELSAAEGVDEDGEPACRMHAVKTPNVNQPETSKAMGTVSKGILPRANCKVCGKEVAEKQMGNHMRRHGGDSAPKPKRAYRRRAVAGVTPRENLQSTALGDLETLRANLARQLTAVETVLQLLGKA
jgi:hypothetical protein